MKKILLFAILGSSLLVKAQTGPDLNIAGQFSSFSRNNIQEKMFVHTDKDFYLAGEIVWYKIYYRDGAVHQPLDLSKIAYVEILDNSNKPVMQAKNAISNSTAKGSFFLPSSVGSGTFRLRAYTSWMKNYDAGFFFEKNITIVNTLKPLNLPATTPVKKPDLQFFPEGGNLVANVENRIAFKLNDQYGNGIQASGFIVNQKGDTITSFATSKFGMGNFLLKPEDGQTYKAVYVPVNGVQAMQDLPLVTPTGYILRVLPNASGYRVTVTTNLPAKTNGGEIFMLAHTRQIVGKAEKKIIENGSATFELSKEDINEGVSHVTVFDSDKKPVCERLIFRAPTKKLQLKATTNAAVFSPRKQVEVDISTMLTGNPAATSLSMAVYQVDSLSAVALSDMESYLLLTSDLRGKVESPEYYFSGEPESVIAADNLMMTQGWRRFTWNQPLRRNPVAPVYPPEFDGHVVGTNITYNTGKPVAGVKTYLSVPGTKTQFYPSVTNEDGKAYFDVRDYYGKNEIVVQTELLSDSNYRIEISDPFSDRYSTTAFPAFNIDRSQSNIILNHSVAMQAVNAYMSDSLTRFDLPKLDSSPFYGRYTKKYLLDDYVRFTTMEEVLREYIPEIGIKRTGGQQRLLISDWSQTKYLEGEPLLLLDGVPVTHKQILGYDPMKVRALEVVTNRYIKGKFVFDGIASFNSYAGNMPEFVFDPKTVILDYEGLQIEREFYSPVYDTEQQRSSRLPDFRDLLTWQPDLETGTNGKASARFYTSDRTGNFIGVIHGIDAAGNASSQVFHFKVAK